MKICQIENCGRPVLAKMLCSKCYEIARYRKPGFAEAKKAYQKTPERLKYGRERSKTAQFKLNQLKYQATDKFVLVQQRYKMKIDRKYAEGIKQSARRGILWKLSFEEYQTVVASRKCHYCPNPLTRYGHDLDRKDNTTGYVFDNVVPCCKDCNRTKGDRLTYDEMVAVSNLLTELRSKK